MTKEELQQKARERAPAYMDMTQRAIYASAYVDGAEETTEELQTQNRRLEADCQAYNYSQHSYQDRIKELEDQLEKMRADVISERDEALRLEDVITYTVLNNILEKWGIK